MQMSVGRRGELEAHKFNFCIVLKGSSRIYFSLQSKQYKLWSQNRSELSSPQLEKKKCCKSLPELIYGAFMKNLYCKEFYSITLEKPLDS